MMNPQLLMNQIGNELEFSRQSLAHIEAELHVIVQALGEMDNKLERAKDSRDIVRGLGEIAKQVDAVNKGVAQTEGRYSTVQRAFQELLRQVR